MTVSEKPLPKLEKRQLTIIQKQQPNVLLGAAGEERAVQFLLKKHFQIIDRNIRYSGGEVDVVAIDPLTDEVVFVEVKTRSSGQFGEPSGAVNFRKLTAMKRMAWAYLAEHRLEIGLGKADFRFDLITILPNEIEHYENITW